MELNNDLVPSFVEKTVSPTLCRLAFFVID